MGRIPQEFIDDVVQRVDIVEVIGSRVTLKQKGRDFWAPCPFHNEKTPSFKVDTQKQLYYCFGCGQSGNLLSFMRDFERLTFIESIEQLAQRAGLEMPRAANTPKGPDLKPLYDVMTEAMRWFNKHIHNPQRGVNANAYLRKRGLTDEVVHHFRLGFAPRGWDNLLKGLGRHFSAEQLDSAGLISSKPEGQRFDRFRDRIMFPIRSTSGRVVAFGARALNPEDEPKYLNSPETPLFNKSHHLYGLYENSGASKQDYLLFVEGYMDVIALTQAGVGGAVACMGTTVSETQLKLAFRYASKLYFCFDGDAAGRKAAARTLERLLPVLEDTRMVHFIFLKEGDDPDSLVQRDGQKGFLAQMKAAMPLSNFLFEHLREGLDLHTIEGRAMLSDRALTMIQLVAGPNLRKLLLQSLGELTGLIHEDGRPLPSASPSKTKTKSSTSPNLVRTALYFLLQAPAEASALTAADCSWLKELDDNDAILLDQTIKKLHQFPTDNAAVLIAQFNGEPDYERLLALYKDTTHLPEIDQATTFRAVWQRLQQRAENQLQKNRLRELKSKADMLSDEEVAKHLAQTFTK